MRRRKHGVQFTMKNGKTLTCPGTLTALYARVDGQLRSVGYLCLGCREIQLDDYPGEVWRPPADDDEEDGF